MANPPSSSDRHLLKEPLFLPCDQDSAQISLDQLDNLQASIPLSLPLLELLSTYSATDATSHRSITQLLTSIVTSPSYFFPDIPLLFDRSGVNLFVPDDNQFHKLNWESLVLQCHVSVLAALGWNAFLPSRRARRTSGLDDSDLPTRVSIPSTESSHSRGRGSIRPDSSLSSLVRPQQSRNIGTFQAGSSLGASPSVESFKLTFTVSPSLDTRSGAAASDATQIAVPEIGALFDFQVNCAWDGPLFKALVLSVFAKGLLDRACGYLLARELADQFGELGVHANLPALSEVNIVFDDYFNSVVKGLVDPDVEELITADLAADKIAAVFERIGSLEPFVIVPHTLEFLEKSLSPLCYHENGHFAARANTLLSHLYNGHVFDLPTIEVVTAERVLSFPALAVESTATEIAPLLFIPGKYGVYAAVLPGVRALKVQTPGYYDFFYARVSGSGGIEIDQSLPMGRYIVLPAGSRKEIIHELPAFDDRGPFSFEVLIPQLRKLLESGVTAVHLTGAIERNVLNGLTTVTDHAVPSKQCGGAASLKNLCAFARRYGVRVLVDFLPLVALHNWSRKYAQYQVMTIDSDGLYRTARVEGGDLMLVNFRSRNFWDLIGSEMLQLVEIGVGGFFLGDVDAWDLVFPRDLNELTRVDPDGELHYYRPMIIEGTVIVDPAESKPYGIRESGVRSSPFFAKLLRTIWAQNKDVLVWARCSEENTRFVIESGIIPQTAAFMETTLRAIDQGLHNGDLMSVHAGNQFKQLYDQRNSQLPKGSLLVASFGSLTDGPFTLTTEGISLALDALVFLSDIPLLNGLIEASVYDPSAYDFTKANATPCTKWHPATGKFETQLRERAAVRLRAEWALMGDIVLLPVTFDYKLCDPVVAVARICPITGKIAIFTISFFMNDLIYEIGLNQIPAVKNASEESVISLKEILVPSAKAMYYGISEINRDQSGAFLDTPKFESHVYELTLTDPAVGGGTGRRTVPEYVRRLLMGNVTARLQHAMEFHSMAILSNNLIFRQLLRFVETPPSSDEILTFMRELPTGENMVSLLLRAMFFASRYSIDPQSKTLNEITNDEIVSTREENLMAFLEVLKSHTIDSFRQIGEDLVRLNRQGPIMFVAPELGPFSKVGGLSGMVWELAKELVQLGLDIHCVSPYYNVSPKGETGYLAKYNVEYKFNIDLYTPDQNPIGVHYGLVDGVKCWFIHHFQFFAVPYQTGSASFRLKTLVIMARAPLEICCQIRLFPTVFVSNDWMTGLLPVYGRHMFGTAFTTARFLHIFHNLGTGYSGKIWPSDGNPWALHDIHQVPDELIIDQFDRSIDPSLSALLCADQWATVSKKYRDELLEGSPYNFFLRRFPAPFAYSNGIRFEERLEALKKLGLDHTAAKRAVQEKFFGDVDDNKMVLIFIGRIVEQKGVFLIIDSFETLHRQFNGKLQFIVGGQAAPDDRAYGLPCTQRMWDLRHRFPKNFWADPSAFFYDGLLCCQAADLMLVPSLFEPSGIVQQEAFASGCPVLAFRTGGLADTVFEFDAAKRTGNGFLFWSHRHRDFVWAVERAVAVFSNPEEYQLLRKNAFESTLSTEKVAREWAREFARLHQKFYEPGQPKQEFVLQLPGFALH